MITFLLIVLGGFAYLQLGKLRDAEQDLETNWLKSMVVCDDIQISLLEARLASIRLLAATKSGDRSASIEQIERARDLLNERTDLYRHNLISDEQERKAFEAAAALMGNFLDGLAPIVELHTTDNVQAVAFANTEQFARAAAYQTKLTLLRNHKTEGAEKAGSVAKEVYVNSTYVVSAVVAGALLLTIS